jgi:hypothetical protein
MVSRYVFAVWLVCWCGISVAQMDSVAEATKQSDKPETMHEDVDEVLVVGEQPGPSLWRVYKGDHVLWVLGTISPLSKKMQWHSAKVNEVLSGSQEYLTPPDLRLEVGFWSQVGLLPSLIGIKNNPDGKKLSDVLSPDLYARWSPLKTKYIGKDSGIEKQRPIFAGTELFKQSIDKSDLVPNDSVRWALENIVRSNKIKTTHPQLTYEFHSPRAAIKKFKKSSLDDTQCFSKIIERLETDLDSMRARANAWAVGDIARLQSLPHPDDEGACEEAVLRSEVAQDQGLQDIKTELKAAWLAAAEAALTNNTSSFAMLPMREVLSPDGYLAALKAKGYEVEQPQE